MAYYNSITTRFGEVYTSASDNAETFVGDQSALIITDNEIRFNSNTHVQWDGSVGTNSDTDLICFNRAFRFGTMGDNVQSNRRITGTTGTNAGKHAYFVNCTFYFDGAQTQQSSPNLRIPLLGASAGDWDVTREYAIPSSKSGNGTFNFYNCKFIYNMVAQNSANNNTNTGIVFGDFVDNTFLNIQPNSGEFVFYPQPGATITGNATDYTVHTTDSIAGGSIYQFDGVGPSSFEDNSIQNYYIYPVQPDGLFEFPFLDASQTILYVSANGGAAPANPPVIRTQDFGSQFTNTSVLTSPRTDLRQNGNIYWRNSRNNADNDRPRVVASRRFERNAYTDPSQGTPRNLMKYHFKGNVNYTTAGEAYTIEVSDSQHVREYVTDFNGALTGTYNFIDGSSSASVEQKDHLDVPISYFKADGANAVANTSDFYTTQFNFDTVLTAVSLRGQTNYTSVYDSDLWAANDSEAAARDGYWIERDIVNEIDQDDPWMVNYGDTDDILSKPGAGKDISPNDVYAIFKYAVWRQDEADGKFVNISQFPYGHAVLGEFDMSALDIHDLVLSNNNASNPYSVDDDEFSIQTDNLVMKDDDVITSLKVNNLNFAGKPILANVNAVGGVNSFQRFASLPDNIDTDTGVSAKGVTLGGNVVLPGTGNNNVFVFNNITWDTATIRRFSDVARDDNVYLVNGTSQDGLTISTDNTDNGSISVISIIDITVNLDTAVSALTDIHTSFLESTDGSTFVDATVTSSTLSDDGLTATYSVTLDVTDSTNELYYAIAPKQHEIVRGKTQVNTPVTPAVISTSALNFDATIPAGDDSDLIAASFVVDPPASASDTFTVTLTGDFGLNTTAQPTRLKMRRFQEDSEWLSSVAKNFIRPDYFDWTVNVVEIPTQAEANRISIQRNATNNLWTFGTRVALPTGTDLYKQLSTTNPQTYIEFTQNANGASGFEIQAIIDAQTDVLDGTSNVDHTELHKDIQTAALGIPVSDR